MKKKENNELPYKHSLLKAIENLQEQARIFCEPNTVMFQVTFTAQGYSFTSEQRPVDSLKAEGIAMKNISGKWIK